MDPGTVVPYLKGRRSLRTGLLRLPDVRNQDQVRALLENVAAGIRERVAFIGDFRGIRTKSEFTAEKAAFAAEHLHHFIQVPDRMAQIIPGRFLGSGDDDLSGVRDL